MKLGKKIAIACLGVLLFAVAEYILYYVFHYVRFRDYKDTLTSYTVEEGKEYKPLTANAKDGYDLVSKSDDIELYVNVKTGDMAVLDKNSDEWYYSTPTDIDNDTVANETNKNKLKSQLIINFFNANRNEGSYSSFKECVSVSTDQLTAQSIDNGVRMTYHFKQKARSVEVIPFQMSVDRFQMFFDKMSSSTQKFIKDMYFIYDDDDLYELKEDLRDGKGIARNYDRIKKAFYEEAGYTDEDYVTDMEGTEYLLNLPASFKVSIEYRVDGDSLVVNVPTSLIEEVNGSIYTIEVLPGFGYADKNTEGYFVVPNGSGSLVNFNNAKRSQYSAYIYGIDPLASDYTKVEDAQVARIPIYGICRDDSSILAAIEDGSSLAQISTQTAGSPTSLSSYNTADFTFALRGRERLSMFGTVGNAANIPIVEKSFANANIQVRYSFLSGDNNGYSGIANYYRDKLVADKKLTELGDNTSTAANDIGFYYDLIGAVKVTDFFLGVRYLGVEPMTTYKQAKEIAQLLESEGVKNQVVNFQGWFNGGYYHDVADKVKNIRKLGSEKQFEEFSSYVEGLGGRVYGDVAFQKVTYISKRYNETFESCRYYAGYNLNLGQVNPTTLRQTAGLGYSETLYSIVSPKYLVRYVDKFIDKTSDLDITGISLRDLGDIIASDKKRTEVIDREMALDIITAQIQKFADSDKKVMVSGGNDYAALLADDMINVPVGHNVYYGVDEEIPLYEMIFHGCVDYACYNINTSDTYDVDDISLRLIEYGSAPHFVFTYDEANEMKYTGLNASYSTTFTTWKDTAVEIYNKVNGALKYVKNANIVEHKTIEDGVKKVTYSNGVEFIINTTNETVSVDGTSVDAMSYAVKGVN